MSPGIMFLSLLHAIDSNDALIHPECAAQRPRHFDRDLSRRHDLREPALECLDGIVSEREEVSADLLGASLPFPEVDRGIQVGVGISDELDYAFDETVHVRIM